MVFYSIKYCQRWALPTLTLESECRIWPYIMEGNPLHFNYLTENFNTETKTWILKARFTKHRQYFIKSQDNWMSNSLCILTKLKACFSIFHVQLTSKRSPFCMLKSFPTALIMSLFSLWKVLFTILCSLNIPYNILIRKKKKIMAILWFQRQQFFFTRDLYLLLLRLHLSHETPNNTKKQRFLQW